LVACKGDDSSISSAAVGGGAGSGGAAGMAGAALDGSNVGGSAGAKPDAAETSDAGPDVSADNSRTDAGGGDEFDANSDGAPDSDGADCMQNADCPTSGYVCTIAHKCGRILGPCSNPRDCMGDSYCCDALCRIDQQKNPVCIPGDVPPGGVCSGPVPLGVFSPAVQCDWPTATPATFPEHVQVLSTPMVATLADPRLAGSAAIVFVAGNQVLGADPSAFGVIRIVRGRDCALVDTIADVDHPLRLTASPALGDLDGDGKIDIVARTNDNGLVAFRWDGAKYMRLWASAASPANASPGEAWDGPAIHDLDDDGKPEVLLRGAVYNGQTGALVDSGALVGTPFNGLLPVVGDLDRDGKVELVASTKSSETTTFSWLNGKWAANLATLRVPSASHFAYADFGTPGAVAALFDFKTLDGTAEIVAVDDNSGDVSVYTLNGQQVFHASTADRGGPPVVGDVDADGFPEIGVAGRTHFWLLDPDCRMGGVGCQSNGVRWSQPSQDATSAQTGASIFDFDADGKAEIVYADECFLRVYDGKTGAVIYSSSRRSITNYENPVIADVNHDDGTAIVVNSNDTGGIVCPTGTVLPGPYIDPLHRGLMCSGAADCVAGTTCSAGFCRCTGDCGDPGLTCADPPAGTPGTGKTCRATHSNTESRPGVRVLRDRLRRWVSSRPLWNQHTYSITNVNDDGTIPQTSKWIPNFTMRGYNNYRQNSQGTASFENLPDLIVRFDRAPACVANGGSFNVQATLCNRGRRSVPVGVPITFSDAARTSVLCTVYTGAPVAPSSCVLVGCVTNTNPVGSTIVATANDDGKGGRGTVECNYDNDVSQTVVGACAP
jgi:hypothetical protein